MTKRAETHWRVGEFADGTPFIVLEPFKGDELNMFGKSIHFDLPPRTSYEQAQEIAQFLKTNLLSIGES